MSNIFDQTAEISSEEKRALLAQLLREKAKKTKSTTQNQCLHERFESVVEKNPDAIAVIAESKQLTYRELNQRANQLAHHLRSLSIMPFLRVGIYMERSWETFVGLLGILKAGGAYVPLEPTYPKEQLDIILNNTQISVVLTQQHLISNPSVSKSFPPSPSPSPSAPSASLRFFNHSDTTKFDIKQDLQEHNPQVLCIDADWHTIAQNSEANPINHATLDSIVCVIKGHSETGFLEHRSLHQRLDWLSKQFNLSQSDAVLYKSSLLQDTAIWEIFLPLVTGGRAIVAAEDNSPTALQHLIAEHNISLIHFVPSDLSNFLKSLNIDISTKLPSLRYVFCSGEPLSQKLVEQFLQHFTCELRYFYSRFEAGGEITSFVCSPSSNKTVLRVGHPTNKPVYILDQSMQLVPVGIVGEVYVGGSGLARGDLHPQETSHPFVANPFSETPNARLFKTGELGRLLNNGSLELVGSLTRQVWFRGFRVDLQEIEAALLTALMVEDCRVLVRTTEEDCSELVAYVALSGLFLPEQLQSHLRSKLPAHMLPHTYVPLTSLPLTAIGEVDEEALLRIAVIDTYLVQRWESSLHSLPEVEQVAVVVQEQTEKSSLLHLSDLLPDWKTNVTGDAPQVSVSARSQEFKSSSDSKKLAISYGGSIPEDTNFVNTLQAVLERASRQVPTNGLVYVQSDGSEISQSYQELLANAERVLAGLRQLGLKPQDKVIFQLDLTQDFIPAFWGCVLGGFIPVPVSVAPTYDQVNSAVNKLQVVWQMLGKPLVLTGTKLAPKVRSLSGLLGLEGFEVESIDELRQYNCDCASPTLRDRNWHNSDPEDLALLMLTSGSTGIPKAVPLTHRNLLSMTAGTILMNGFNRQDVTLNWMPMDHVGALIFLSTMAVDLGCQQVQVPTEFILQNPLKWLDLIDRHQGTISWAPNFAFTLICDRTEEISRGQWNLSSMRFLVNAGEAVVSKTARNFLKLLGQHGLPSTALHPAFGMCETCSGITWSNSFSLETTSDEDAFVPVGPPIAGAELRIVDRDGQVVEEGVTGRLQLRGNSVTSGYYQNPEANQQAFNKEGWFTTGDLGFLSDGCLIITGREKDVIIINGFNYYSHEIESAVEEIEGVEVSYTGACAVREGGNTDKLAIFFNSCFSDENLLSQIKEIRAKVIERIGINPDYLIPIEKEQVPKTAIGKIQRSQLSQRFEAGEFNSIIKQFDLLTGNANTLPSWFYRKVWRPKKPEQKPGFSNKPGFLSATLIFLDSLGMGDKASTQLEQSLQACIRVETGIEFTKLAANRYRIAPGNPHDYQLLLESLVADGYSITQILHLWTYNQLTEVSNLEDLAKAQEQGAYSLLFLVQALAKVQGSTHSVQLQVISSHVQGILPDDVVSYAKAPILGFIKTIPQEMPWLTCRHIDLPVEQIEVSITHILGELSIFSKEREVAYRQGKRLVSQLEQVDLSEVEKQPLPFKQGGMYLVSGGLGDIGVEVAKYLLQHYQTRLLLIGRTPLTDLEKGDSGAQRIQSYQMLKQLGGEVLYQAVDICNLEQLQQVIALAESQWNCQMDGIIHLAGSYQEHLLIDETLESLTATFQPKVFGTWTLHQLIQDKPESVFISFSSIASFFGGAMIGSYAAANSFLDSFSQYQRSQGLSRSYCFAWSSWDGLGVSSRSQMKGLAQVRGYYAIAAKQGLHSLLAGLHHNQTHLLVGIDGHNLNIRRFTNTQFHIQKLAAYFTASTDNLPGAQMQSLVVSDRFETRSTSDFVQLEEMPLTDTGTIDREQLITLGNQRRNKSEKVAPRTDLEKQIVNIWQDVLGISQIGIYDNFFELGGNSLLGVQLISRVSEAFQVELPLSALLEAQTVAGLASLLGRQTDSQADSPLVAIQPTGNKPPFFCVHPVGGNILCYGELARHLGTEQPFYGLQSPGLNGSEPLTSIEDMATHYIKAIRTVQPEGPYYLGGWSLGGIIALEMASLLRAGGQEVALLVFIDSYTADTVTVPEAIDHAMLLASVVRDMGEIAGKELPVSAEKLLQLSLDEQLLYVHEEAKRAKVLPPEFSIEQMRQLLNVFRANHQAWYRYIPQSYSGKITLFYASDRLPQANRDPAQYWAELAAGGIESYRLFGNHYTIMREPQVQILSKQLKACLK